MARVPGDSCRPYLESRPVTDRGCLCREALKRRSRTQQKDQFSVKRVTNRTTRLQTNICQHFHDVSSKASWLSVTSSHGSSKHQARNKTSQRNWGTGTINGNRMAVGEIRRRPVDKPTVASSLAGGSPTPASLSLFGLSGGHFFVIISPGPHQGLSSPDLPTRYAPRNLPQPRHWPMTALHFIA